MSGPAPMEARSVRFGYRRGQSVLHGIDLRVDPGEVVALTGPSGTGKSTLLYVLGGMLRPTSGTVLVDGADLGDLDDAGRSVVRSRKVGFVFQDAVLDARRSVIDAVLEPALYARVERRALRERAHALLTQLGVSVPSDARPGQISGGQAQRVAVCRALLLRPSVVLADEPTGNLDAVAADAVIDALLTAARDRGSVVIATHDPRVVRRCDRVVALR